jgi:putative transposase
MYYRRAQIPGATYFFTVNLANRKLSLLVDYIEFLKESIRDVKTRHPFEILAMVVLPDHLHTVWTLPPNGANFATRWALIKAGFSRRLPKGERISQSRRMKSERGIWQRRFWEHVIRNDDDLLRHIDYIHYNPVKHGYVERAVDWPHSSIHRFIREGVVTADWAVDTSASNGGWGERG